MRLSRADLVLALVSVSAAAVLTVFGRFGWPELLFFTVMLTSLTLLSREVWRAHRREQELRQEALRVVRIRPDDVAAEAVRDERRRLSEDIAAELRGMLTQVRHEAVHSEDAGATARSIHRHARLASSELRRLLGLLRTSESVRGEVRPAPVGAFTGRAGRDRALAGAAGALALVESIAYPRAEGRELDWWSVALTVAVAVTVLGRTISPVLMAVAAAGLVGLGAVSGHGVTGGFWMLLTATGLFWATVGVSGAPTLRSCAGLLFAATLTTSTWVSDQENAVATTLVVCALLAVAVVVRAERARAHRALHVVARHRSSIAEAAAAAVEADRAAYAREIHDSVSHAVGLIAMQAGAAEVSARRCPQAALSALALIAAAAADALADLDRMHPDASLRTRTVDDFEALFARIRAAGKPVTITGLDHLPATRSDVAYRILQEALTNVVRHGAGAPAHVRLAVDPASVMITVEDGGPGPRQPSEQGFGLVGLAERVRQTGGNFRAGAGAGGRGFVVEATLPATQTGVW